MGQTDEAASVLFLNLCGVVVDNPAILKRRVPTQNTAQHGDIDPTSIHILDLRLEVKQLRMNVGLRDAILFNDSSSGSIDPHSSRQLDRDVVMLKINNHSFLAV